jgi:hypothetical protein
MGITTKNSRETTYGKGDNPRPVDRDKYEENFDRIFGKKEKTIKDERAARRERKRTQG